jgi:hypothetical protein
MTGAEVQVSEGDIPPEDSQRRPIKRNIRLRGALPPVNGILSVSGFFTASAPSVQEFNAADHRFTIAVNQFDVMTLAEVQVSKSADRGCNRRNSAAVNHNAADDR